MRFKKTIAASAVALGVLSFGGAALASGSGTSAPEAANEQSQSVDNDNVQEGDQTSPDNGAETTDAADEGSGSEAAGESDGPGGHEDPPGDVNHEFDGEE